MSAQKRPGLTVDRFYKFTDLPNLCVHNKIATAFYIKKIIPLFKWRNLGQHTTV